MRGGHDPHVDLDRLLSAHAIQPAVLQDPQQADLGGQRQLADFVQQQRAAVGPLEPALAGFDRPGEAPRSWPNSCESISSWGWPRS